MNKKEFCEIIKKNVKNYLPEEYKDADVLLNDVVKNNDVTLTGLTVRKPGQVIAPTIYLDSYYDEVHNNGRTVGDILKEIAQIRVEHDSPDVPNVAEDIKDYESVKNALRIALYDPEKNKEKLAQSISDRTVGRFNVGYILVFPVDDQVGSIKVTKSMLEAWGVSEEQLFADALANDREKEALFTSLSAMMAGFMGGPVQNLFKMEQDEAVREAKQATGSGIPLFILTIRDGFYASSLMADEDLLRKISEILQEDYFILPSSIHEVLIAPRSVSDAEYLKETVKVVNTEQVAEVEQLSDNIHLYCYKEHILTAA